MKSRTENSFFNKLEQIKSLAREEARKGNLKPSNYPFIKELICLLNYSLASEIVCIHRYKKHYYTALALGEPIIAHEFLKHAKEKQTHADKLADRIAQLGGTPEYELLTIKKTAHTEYMAADGGLEEMLIENLVAERIAVAIYQELIDFVANRDPVTRRILEDILAVEEDHVKDMHDFLDKNKYMAHLKSIN